MLRLAGEIADVAHFASWFINRAHYQDNIAELRRGAERGGRTLADLEIDVSIPVCIATDRARARRPARRLAAQAILWMEGAEAYVPTGGHRRAADALGHVEPVGAA